MKFLAQLQNPPREFTAIPFWFLNGELTAEELRRQLADFAAHGIYGVVLHPRMGLSPDITYLGERYFAHIRTAVEAAAALDMKIVLYDEGMYPSGSASGLVVKDHPELASEGITLTQTVLPGDELLAQAENMEDIITIESAISETEWNIEDLSGTLRHYDALVDFATVNVHVSEVYKYSDTEELPENFGDRLSSAMSRGWHSFVNGMEDFAVALAYSWMWLILWVVIIVTAVVILRKIRRRSGMKKPLFKKKNDVKPDDKSGDT